MIMIMMLMVTRDRIKFGQLQSILPQLLLINKTLVLVVLVCFLASRTTSNDRKLKSDKVT